MDPDVAGALAPRIAGRRVYLVTYADPGRQGDSAQVAAALGTEQAPLRLRFEGREVLLLRRFESLTRRGRAP